MLPLKALLLASFLLIATVSSQEQCAIERIDVVIVGAGVAGISTASRFVDNYVLLESSDRIGGRVKSQQFGGFIIEEGANWITGDNIISDLANQYGLESSTSDMFDVIAYDTNGFPIDIDVYQESLQNFQGALDDAAKVAFQQFEPSSPVVDRGILHLLRESGWNTNSMMDQMVQWSMIDWEFTVPDTSVRNFYAEIEDMELVVDQRGYEHIVQRFFQDNIDSTRLRLNHRVYRIDYNVDSSTHRAKVFALTESGGCIEYQANHVALTVSIGVLNAGLIEFSPPLQYQGSNPFAFGQFAKVFFTFAENFWDDNEFILTENEQGVGLCHQWHNLDRQGLIFGSKMLRCDIMTEEFLALLDPVNQELSEDTLMGLLEPLRRTYGDLVQPVDKYYTKLHQSQDFGFGAYSHWKIGYGFRDYAHFFGGIEEFVPFCNHNGCNSRNEWVLHISGSASCYAYQEYVHGAYYSGQRTADNILRSQGEDIPFNNECDQYFPGMMPLIEPYIERNPRLTTSTPMQSPIADATEETTLLPTLQPNPLPVTDEDTPTTEVSQPQPVSPTPVPGDKTPLTTMVPAPTPVQASSGVVPSPTAVPEAAPSAVEPENEDQSSGNQDLFKTSNDEESQTPTAGMSTTYLVLWVAFGVVAVAVVGLSVWLVKICYTKFSSGRKRPQSVVKVETKNRSELPCSDNFATEVGSSAFTDNLQSWSRSSTFSSDEQWAHCPYDENP